MADLFEKFKELVAPSKIKTDSFTGPLFYKVSFGICLTSFIILFGNQYFGDPMVCINNDLRIDFLENHCWMHGTTRIKNDGIKNNSYCDYDPDSVDKVSFFLISSILKCFYTSTVHKYTPVCCWLWNFILSVVHPNEILQSIFRQVYYRRLTLPA